MKAMDARGGLRGLPVGWQRRDRGGGVCGRGELLEGGKLVGYSARGDKPA
jgi:hypothetical protein